MHLKNALLNNCFQLLNGIPENEGYNPKMNTSDMMNLVDYLLNKDELFNLSFEMTGMSSYQTEFRIGR